MAHRTLPAGTKINHTRFGDEPFFIELMHIESALTFELTYVNACLTY